MSEWRECKFKELFLIPLKNGLTKPSRIRGSGLRMVNMKEIFGFNFIDDKTPMECVPVSENEIKNSLLSYDDLLFARQSLTEEGAGKISIFKGKEETVFESHLIRCRIDKNKANPDFIYYLFKSPIGKGTVSTIVQQVAAAGIKGSDLQNLEFTIPNLPEQKAIAAVLSSLDDKIDLLHRQNKTLEAMAEMLFKQWFVIEAQEDWEEKSLLDVVQLVGGGTPKTSTQEYWDGDIPWLSGGDIASNHKSFIISSDKTITQNGLNNSSAKLLPKYATVISARGTVGKYCLLSKEMAYSQSNYGILPKINNCFFFTYLLINHVVSELQSSAYGSVFDTITTSTFQENTVSIPKEIKIIEFEKQIAVYFHKKFNNQKQIQTLETLRDNLLPKLMSGEVRVNYQ
ncbi:MAG: restriction endonuclease subunit S [Methylococcales bacterium]